MTTTPRRRLTVRGVKQMLTRAGIDHAGLDFRQVHEEVHIYGPKEVRRGAVNGHLFWEVGLSVAPYPDHDCWGRPRL